MVGRKLSGLLERTKVLRHKKGKFMLFLYDATLFVLHGCQQHTFNKIEKCTQPIDLQVLFQYFCPSFMAIRLDLVQKHFLD